MLKKVFSCSLAIVLALLGVFAGEGGCRDVSAANQIDWEKVFLEMDPGVTPGQSVTIYPEKGWVGRLKTQLGSSVELVFPDKLKLSEEYLQSDNLGFDAEEAKKLSVEAPLRFRNDMLSNSKESYSENMPNITSLVFGTGMGTFFGGALFRFPNVEKVTFNADGLALRNNLVYLDAYSNEGDKNTYASKLTEIHIKGNTISEDMGADAFKYINENVKVYVESDDIKNQLLEITQKGSAPLKAENITNVNAELPMPEFEIVCPDIHKGEVFAKPTISIVDGKGDADAPLTIEDKLYLDKDGTQQSSYYYYSPGIPEGTYYVKVTVGATPQYQSLTKYKEIKVLGNQDVNKTALDAAIAEADKFYADNQRDEKNYKAEDWNNVFGTRKALAIAKEISGNKDGSFTQTQVDEATKNLTDALETLKKSVADNTEAWNQLQEAIKKAEAVIPDKDKYTDESWTQYNLPKRIEEAKALDKNAATSTVKEIERHISLLDGAINGLKLKPIEPVVKPGTPFAYIPKKGSQVKVLSMTAPENLAGATKVRVTFKCADDVSFNENASIDIDPVIAGTSNYLQIKGTGDYTTGATYSVDVPLSAAIKAGDSIEIIMATFAWENAADYVYGVTAIEFLDGADKSLGAYTDKDVYKENLASAIKEAEAINTSTYTAESVEKLKKALEAAKALKEDATAEEMKKAIDAINDAIKGLEKKDDEKEEAREKLTAKVKEAEAIDTSLYTPESVEKLKKALEAAKALKDDASEEEINKVMADIEAAIKGLVKKDDNAGPGKDDPQPPKTDEQTKVIGVAKGKTFAAGSIKYKVSVAATMKGTVKTAGKVTVVGLSSKKKTSVNVKNTVSASGASYQVTGIASKAFRKAAKLKKATLGSNIKSIPTSAFESCKKLTTVKATGVTKIGSKAFKGCKVLKKLTFGKKKLSSVKKGAFKGCKKTIKVAGGSKKVKKGNVKKLKKSGYKKFK